VEKNRKKNKNKKQTGISVIELLSAVIFISFFLVFGVITLVSPKSDYSMEEKRALQELPEWSKESCLDGTFQNDYESYLSDQFIGRSSFVKVKTKIGLLLGENEINDVYVGKDGYLLEKYEPGDFDDEWVTGNIWYLSDFLNAMLQDYGENHVRCLFVPSKANVLTNKLPACAETYNTSYVVENLRKDLTENLDMNVDVNTVVGDVTEILKSHQDEYIYYRTDHHWTTRGAYYAYESYLNSLGRKAASLDSYEYVPVSDDFYGTTFDKVQVAGTADTISALQTKSRKLQLEFYDGETTTKSSSYYDDEALSTQDKYNYFLGGNTAQIRISTGTKNGKTLLLIKDSYSNSFVEYLEGEYETIYMIDLRYARKDIYTQMDEISEKDEITDIFVMYNIEKFMQDNNLDLL
jgi:hypothetical protein